MIFNQCPACRRVNAADAQCCEACGFNLAAGEPQPLPLHQVVELRHPGALWLDELVAPQSAPHATETAEAPALSITLRDIQLPPTLVVPAPAALPAVEDLVASDPEVPESVREAWARTTEVLFPVDPAAASLTAKKSARRAAVRRARLHGALAADGAAPALPRVLVLDADAGSRARLSDLLRNFGFDVHPAPDATEASTLVTTSPFVAAFVDIALDAADGGAGIGVCKRIREASQRGGGTATLLVLVAAQLRPIDRVRAELVGCGEAILKPVTRGSVARVLDSHGIALPSDARRA